MYAFFISAAYFVHFFFTQTERPYGREYWGKEKSAKDAVLMGKALKEYISTDKTNN